MTVTRIWDDVLSEHDREIIVRSGWGKLRGYGKRPAVLVIDAQYTFVGAKNEIMNSLDTNCMGIGNEAWEAVEKIHQLLGEAHSYRVPVIYSVVRRDKAEQPFNWAMYKRYKTNEPTIKGIKDPMEIVSELTPCEGELVIKKQYPSAFFGTTLSSYLVSLKIDTLLVTGFVTSGCVRATVNDACQNGYNTVVVEECVADRISISHKIELLDMDLKYADVLPMHDVIKYIRALVK